MYSGSPSHWHEPEGKISFCCESPPVLKYYYRLSNWCNGDERCPGAGFRALVDDREP